MRYEYKMIQINPSIEIKVKDFKGDEAAKYLESLINKYAEQEWEFWRIDLMGIITKPGCLGGLFGSKAKITNYYIITFRKSRN